jgi:hypothetical protein
MKRSPRAARLGPAPTRQGGVTTPATPAGPIPGTAGTAAGTAGTANQPATTGSTGMGGTIATPARVDDGTPARAMVSMSKADLQNAPEFRYSTEVNRTGAGGAGNTNPPPASANRPGNAPQQ